MVKNISLIVLGVVIALAGTLYASNRSDQTSTKSSATAVVKKSEQAKAFTPEQQKLVTEIQAKLGLQIVSIASTPIAGINEIMTNQGMFYVSNDGSYLIQGKIYGLTGDVTNITEQSLSAVRREGIERFADDMIVYPAENEKYVITVFTDITCGYCRRMHEQMDEYNDRGITVRYLPYPRDGVVNQFGQLSKGYQDLRSIWCHEEPSKALTRAKAGGMVAQRICEKPVKEEYDFGRQVGVTATPTIILDNGLLLPGYRKPADLEEILASF